MIPQRTRSQYHSYLHFRGMDTEEKVEMWPTFTQMWSGIISVQTEVVQLQSVFYTLVMLSYFSEYRLHATKDLGG